MANKDSFKHVISACLFLSAGLILPLQADVSVSVSDNCQSFTVSNSTTIPWKLGGIRFYDKHSYWNYAADGEGNGWNMIHQTSGSRMQQDLFFESTGQSTPAPVGSILVADTSVVFTRGYNTDTDTAFPDMFVLLRTGGPDVPDDPPDAGPLTLAQLDSVIAVHSTYDSTYRYGNYDSLGSNGGPYSAGFIDTWYDRQNAKAETQIHFPIPPANFTVNASSVNFLGSGLDYYWMSLALVQEYFRVDMQWSAAQAAKETGIGTTFLVLPANQKGVYGYWQITSTSGLDRALCHPQFYPKYARKLSRARDAASSGINADTMLTYYTRGNRGLTPFNSALMLNSCFIAMLNMYVNYDICSYATDICWKNSLPIAVDHTMGVSFMAVMYNVGAYSQTGKVANVLNPNVYQQTCANASAGTLTGTGTNNYLADVINVAHAAAVASRQFEKNNAGLALVDFPISKREFMDMYFGDSGTVDKQGNGGLLLHFYDPAAGNCALVRQRIWNTLDSAFNRLAGRAPSASATTISFRYDFLPLVRTAKQYFPFFRQHPNTGDAALSITANSGNYTPCAGAATDELYPYLGVAMRLLTSGDLVVTDTVRDSLAVKNVMWTIDNGWKCWNKSSVIFDGGSKMKVFGFTVSKDQLAFWRDTINDGSSGANLWVMASDSAGNSCIGRYLVANATPVLMRPGQARTHKVASLRVISKSGGGMRVQLPADGTMGWTMYDLSGHTIAIEQEKPCQAGTIEVRMPLSAHGIYMVQFRSQGKPVQTVKFIR
jgi:hypothetical protein